MQTQEESRTSLTRMPISDLACHSCRKRKVKCDRTCPRCMVCAQTGQTCSYPLRSMKPGPKIGSFQRQKKYQKLKTTARSRRIRSDSRPPPGPDNDSPDGDLDPLEEGLVHKDLAVAIPPDVTEAAARVETRRSSHQQTSQLNILDLAFILHPSHEITTPDETQKQSPRSQDNQKTGLCRQVCAELGISQAAMNEIIRVFFDNMVAINIFHKPSFAEKLSNIASFYQLTALLAAIAGYASRFSVLSTSDLVVNDPVQLTAKGHRQPAEFVDLAFKYINKALAECDDEMPPLCVIQALIIATHCRLTQGVRGKAWRSLGLCVSLVYETDLHLLDSKRVMKPEGRHQWQDDEEKRRAFWAIWEMDVFASTIRRTPTAIDWSLMEILLPVDNAHWFSGHATPSCFMEINPNRRWKALKDSGSQSPKAWYLVINSLMKDAQIAGDLQRASTMGHRGYHQAKPNHRISTRESAVEAQQKLETLANVVHCFSLALPSHLRYRDQYLPFGAPMPGELESQRQKHCSIYNIFVMTQLARLMIYRYDAFRSPSHRPEINSHHHSRDSAGRSTFASPDTEGGALQQYYEAADCMLAIVNRSHEEHIRYINPFLSNTIWLASAVQLVRKHFAREHSNRNLIKSRFDVLYLTYKRCVQFWDIKNALQRNLELIEEQLEARYKRLESRVGLSAQEALKRAPEDTGVIDQSSDREGRHIERTPRQTSQYLPRAPSVPPASINDGLDITARHHAHQYHGPEGMELLDFLIPLQPNRNQTPEGHTMSSNSGFGDSRHQLDQAFDWPTFDFPGGIHDLLAESTMY